MGATYGHSLDGCCAGGQQSREDRRGQATSSTYKPTPAPPFVSGSAAPQRNGNAGWLDEPLGSVVVPGPQALSSIHTPYVFGKSAETAAKRARKPVNVNNLSLEDEYLEEDRYCDDEEELCGDLQCCGADPPKTLPPRRQNDVEDVKVNRFKLLADMKKNPKAKLFSPASLKGMGSNREVDENDTETINWLNWAVQELWPNAEKAIRTLLEKDVLKELQENLPDRLKCLKLSELSLGDEAPVLGPVKVYRKSKQGAVGIELDVGFQWNTGARANFGVSNWFSLGLTDLTLYGEISFVFKPLLDTLPIVGGLQIFMIKKPQLDLQFTGAAQFADFPLIRTAIRQALMKIIADSIVLPNRNYCHWMFGREHETDIAAMKCPMPEGLLRITIESAKELVGKDWHFLGEATSDPYAVVEVGGVQQTTSVQKLNLAPVWSESFDFVVYNRQQEVHIDLYDSDKIETGVVGLKIFPDDFLGRVQGLTVRKLLREADSSKGGSWWFLSEEENDDDDKNESRQKPSLGQVRIKAKAYDFEELHKHHPGRNAFEKAPKKAGAGASSIALLTVNLRRLRGLPKDKAEGAVLRVEIEGQQFTTKPSVYEEPMQDLTYAKAKEIDPVTQRLAEVLSKNHNMPLEDIALLAGADLEDLKLVMKQSPSFTTSWDEGFHILLKEPENAVLSLKLLLADEQKSSVLKSKKDAPPPIELNESYAVKELFSKKKMETEDCELWHLVRKRRVSSPDAKTKWKELDAEESTVKSGFPKGPFDLQIQLKLWGLKIPEVDDREERKRATRLSVILKEADSREDSQSDGQIIQEPEEENATDESNKQASPRKSGSSVAKSKSRRRKGCCGCCGRRRHSKGRNSPRNSGSQSSLASVDTDFLSESTPEV